jgi:hypothetical protein
MKDKVLAIVFLITLAAMLFVLFFTGALKNRTRVYDCSISEISPDFPPEIREECRQLRREEFFKDKLQERKTIST